MCNIYHKYSDALNTFRHAMPFKQSKSKIQMIQLESVLLFNAKWDAFIPSKVFNSFVELSVLYYGTVHVVKNVQVTSKLSPQNHFVTKHILFLKQFHQLS